MEPIGPTLSAEIVPLLSAIKTECTWRNKRSTMDIFNYLISQDRHLSRLEKEPGYTVYQYKGYLIIIEESVVYNIMVRFIHITRDVNYLKKESKLMSEYLWGDDYVPEIISKPE